MFCVCPILCFFFDKKNKKGKWIRLCVFFFREIKVLPLVLLLGFTRGVYSGLPVCLFICLFHLTCPMHGVTFCDCLLSVLHAPIPLYVKNYLKQDLLLNNLAKLLILGRYAFCITLSQSCLKNLVYFRTLFSVATWK